MKAGRIVVISLLILCSAIFLSACSIWPFGGEVQKDKAKLEAELKSAGSKLEQAERDAKVAKDAADKAHKKAEDAATKADTLTAQAVKLKKNPEDPNSAPITYKAIQEQREAEAQAKQADVRAMQADSAVNAAKKEAEEATKNLEATSDLSAKPTNPWVLYSLLALTILVAGAGTSLAYLTRAMLHKKSEQLLRKLGEQQAALASNHGPAIEELNRKVDGLLREQKDQRTELSGIGRTLSALGVKVSGLREAVEAKRVTTGAQYGSEYTGRVVEAPEPVFPISAEEYLSKLGRGAVPVKSDALNDVLVRDTSGAGELVLVPDSGVPDGLLYVVPTVKRFKTKQDFHSYYEKYYECHNPSAGEVWIIEPATVDPMNGVWKLRDKGVLEARR